MPKIEGGFTCLLSPPANFSIVDLRTQIPVLLHHQNLPKTQILDPNPVVWSVPTGRHASSSSRPWCLPINALALTAAGVTVTWKRKEGAGAEANATTGRR